MAFEGAQTFLERCFPDSGTELAIYLMNMLKENGVGLSEERLSKVYTLDGLYEKTIQTAIQKGKQEGGLDANDAVLAMYKLKLRFLKAAHKWAVDVSNRFTGDTGINLLLGKTLIASGKINNGFYYLATGESPTDIFQQVATLPGPNNSLKNKEALLTYSVLGFLGLGNLRDANAIISGWRSCCMLEEGMPKSRLYNFSTFLCKVSEYDAVPVYKGLLTAYKDEIKKYPEFKQLIPEVGKTMFGIAPPPSMLNNVMNMLQQH